MNVLLLNTYKRLFVTEWNPNGTNDLIVLDTRNNSLQYIENSTFGINVEVCGDSITVLDQYGELSEIESIDYDPATMTVLKSVSLIKVLRNVCCSPVDVEGENAFNAISKAVA
jgi:hypothetical protein